jgi:hypothetical protein
MDWDAVRKRRLIVDRGTDADDDVVRAFAPAWRKPFRPAPSKEDLRNQAKQALIDWQSRLQTSGSSLGSFTGRSS